MSRVIPTSPALQQAASLTPASSVSSMWVLVLAAVGYGGYRLYKHFKKG